MGGLGGLGGLGPGLGCRGFTGFLFEGLKKAYYKGSHGKGSTVLGPERIGMGFWAPLILV